MTFTLILIFMASTGSFETSTTTSHSVVVSGFSSRAICQNEAEKISVRVREKTSFREIKRICTEVY